MDLFEVMMSVSEPEPKSRRATVKDYSRTDFYVYAIYEPNHEEPFWIGKGTGNRAYKHDCESNLVRGTHFYNKLRKLKQDGIEPIIVILHDNLTETRAFDLEEELIKSWGRLDLGTGCLTNHTSGGDGAAGYERSEETRRKMSISAKLKETSFETRLKRSYLQTGVKDSKETRQKKSEIAIALRGNPVESYNLQTGETIKKYAALTHVERDNLNRQYVRECIRGQRKHYAGFGWRYSKEGR